MRPLLRQRLERTGGGCRASPSSSQGRFGAKNCGPRGRVLPVPRRHGVGVRAALRACARGHSRWRQQPGALVARRRRQSAVHRARRRRTRHRRRRPHVRRLRRLVGSAHPGSRSSGGRGRDRRARRDGHELRRTDRAGGRARAAGDGSDAVGRAGAPGQLGYRGDDERASPGAGGDRSGRDRQVRRLLPRSRRCAPGPCGIRGAHARRPGQPRGSRRRRRADAARRVQRRRRHPRPAAQPGSRDRGRHRRARGRKHGRRGPGAGVPGDAARGDGPRGCAARSSTR